MGLERRHRGEPDRISVIRCEQRRPLNALFLGADMTLFMSASGLVGPLTLAPLFVSKLSAEPLAVGALAAVFQLGWLPQLLAAGYLERSRRKHTWFIWFGLLERLPVLGLAGAALLVSRLPPPAILALVYLARFSQSLAAGPSATVWLDYIGRSVAPRRRGSFLGVASTLGNLLGVAVAATSGPILDRFGFPLGFAVCFALGCGILVLGWLPRLWIVEPGGPPPRPRAALGRQLGELPAILGRDRAFRGFLLGLGCYGLGAMGDSFLVVYAGRQLGAPDDLAAAFTVALLVGQVLGNLVLGRLADRLGFGPVARIGTLASAGLSLTALLAPTAGVLLGAFLLLGVSQAGWLLARLAGPMAFAPAGRLPSYSALAMALTSLVAAAAPLLASQVVTALGYRWLFGGALCCALAGFVVLGRTRTPDPIQTAEAA